MKEYIQFKRQRELGEILTDTFKFIRLEYKPLFKAIFKNAGIPFIILLAAAGYYAAVATDFNPLMTNGLFNGGQIILGLILMLVALMFYLGFLFGTVLHYIKSYINNQGVADQTEVTKAVRQDLGSIIGLGVLSYLMIIIGFMLCFLPGIYLYVPLSLVFALLVFKRYGVGDSITESFNLIKGEWWITFATLLVIGIIIYLISLVFQIPVMVYMLGKGFASAEEISGGDVSGIFDWVYILLNVVSSAISYLMYTVTVIASAFIYFNLNEKKNQTGTLEQIDTIGSTH